MKKLFHNALFYADVILFLMVMIVMVVPQADAAVFTFVSNAWAALTNITGEGNLNQVAAFSSTNSIGNSIIYDDGANVGIGTTGPGQRLDVRGRIRTGDANGNWDLWGGSNLHFQDDGVDRVFFGSNGNVGIGTTGPGQKLDVNGSMRTSGISFSDDINSGNGMGQRFGVYNWDGLFVVANFGNSFEYQSNRMVIDGSGNAIANDYYSSAAGVWMSQLCKSNGQNCPPGTAIPSLQQVTDAGAVTTKTITAQRYVDDDTSYYADLNSGGNLGGAWTMDYLVVDSQDAINEGGELQLKGAGSYGAFQIDNYQGNARIHTLAAGKQFEVLGGQIRSDGGFCIGGSCITAWPGAAATPNLQQVTDAGNTTNKTIQAQRYFDDDSNFYVDANTVSILNDIRPSIIYDRDNTGYFLDPNGGSQVSGLTITNGLTVGNAGGAYTYITLRDDESPNGVKYVHANSNNIGFLSGAGGWLSRWDNAGNMVNEGSVTAPTVKGSSQLCIGGACRSKWAPSITYHDRSNQAGYHSLGTHDACMLIAYSDFSSNGQGSAQLIPDNINLSVPRSWTLSCAGSPSPGYCTAICMDW